MKCEYLMNHSQESILQNELMLPESGINTIAFRLFVEDKDVDALCSRLVSAVNRVIDSADVFRTFVSFDENDSKLSVKLLDKPASYCSASHFMQLPQAEELCLQREHDTSIGLKSSRLYDAMVIPTLSGCFVSFVFSHFIIDGYSMCLVAQAILDSLTNGKIRESNFWTSIAANDAAAGADLTCSSGSTTDLGDKKYPDSELEEIVPDSATDKAFWKKYFQGACLDSEIFSEETTNYKKTDYSFDIDSALTKKIEEFSAKHNITVSTYLASAFALYLAGVSGKDEAGFVEPRLGRNIDSFDTIGCYTLVVPVRAKVDGEKKFSSLCKTVQETSRMASAHKQFCYSNILEVMRNSCDIGESFSEYTFNFYRHSLKSPLPFNIDISVCGAMHNHLTLNVFLKGESMKIVLNGRKEIYSIERLQSFKRSFINILTEALSDRKVRDISLVNPSDLAEIMERSLGEEYSFDSTATIPSLFRDAACTYSSRPALFAGDKSYTFEQLNTVSDRIACGLMGAGVRKGDPVAFILPRDYRVVPTILGISKSGGVFIPVDPAYPESRIDYIISNSGCKLIVSDTDVSVSAKYDFVRVSALFDSAIDMLLPTLSQDDPAYMIYTSGTTGNPKGVVIPHRGIVNITDPRNNPFNKDIVRTGRGLVAVGSICFDISLFELFVPLFNGMFVEYAPDDCVTNPEKIAALLSRHGANLLHCTPSRLSAFLTSEKFCKSLKGVAAILSAGEVLKESLINELKNTYGIRIYNGYGPTETTIGATITEAGDSLTVGRPIGNMGVIVLDRYGRALPEDVKGELCIYGTGVGLGYHNLDELTKHKFSVFRGRRIYRTGDTGVAMDDGRILFYGRNDNQVKLRGLRIELTGIENRITSYSGIMDAAIVVKSNAKSKYLAAFYVTDKRTAVDEKELHTYLKQNLPSYMVPEVMVRLDSMPQTPGGKTDIKALDMIHVEPARSDRKAETELEKKLCEAFAKTLELDDVSPDDGFFALGGDSISAISLIAMLSKDFGIEIEYGDIFKYSSPADLISEVIERDKNLDSNIAVKNNPLDNLDYSGIDTILQGNTVKSLETRPLGNILLTGATGYLGIHVLLSLLKDPDETCRIYCMVRSTDRLTPAKRLMSTLFYYENRDFSDIIGDRVLVYDGDITDPETLVGLPKDISTVINCAANVSHFSKDDSLSRTNTGGVDNLIDFCVTRGVQLIHISTISVGGMFKQGSAPHVLTEQNLFFGQTITNDYIMSKFMAEYDILRAVADKGLNAKIMRVGNLQGRLSDGEFQVNLKKNAFTRLLSSYGRLGKAPLSLWNSTVNFSPVDDTARIIVELSRLGVSHTVFHVYLPEEIAYSHLFKVLTDLGHEVKPIPDDRYAKFIEKAKSDEILSDAATKLMLEKPNMNYEDTLCSCETTKQILELLDCNWNPITEEYLTKYFSALDGLLLFENL